MSLFDEMEKKPKQATVVESVEAPVVAEEKVTVTQVQQPTAPVQVEPQAVQSTPETTQEKKPYTLWWQTPDYLGEVERRAADAEKQAELEKKRLRRERNAAIISDIAKLGAQAFMLDGGVTNIERFTPNSQIVNDKIASLSEKRAAQIAAFAKERAAARAAQVADNNARMKLETSLAEADLDRKIKAAEKAADRTWEVYKQGKTEEHRAAELELRRQLGERRAVQGNNGYSDEHDAYYEMIAENPALAVTEMVPKRDRRGRYVKNKDGSQVYEEVKVENPSVNQIRNALARGRRAKYATGDSSQKPGEKKKNPMGSGKKANPMN